MVDKCNRNGPQVDASFPPEMMAGGALPQMWKPLPFCALPDGAHNFPRDLVYFRLPDPHSETNQVAEPPSFQTGQK
jgi:hypothetical protein